jgi:hypothetical protein
MILRIFFTVSAPIFFGIFVTQGKIGCQANSCDLSRANSDSLYFGSRFQSKRPDKQDQNGAEKEDRRYD